MDFRHFLSSGVLILILGLAFACSGSGVENEFVTEANQKQILEQAKKELSYEEVELLQGYIKRVEPDLPEGQLPVGRTIGEMISSQKAYEAGSEAMESSGESLVAEAPPVPEKSAGKQSSAVKPGKAAPAPAQTEVAPAQTKVVSDSMADAKVTPEPAPEPEAPTTVSVPSGTILRVRLMESLSTKTATAGDIFETELDDDLVVDGQLLAPEGSRVTGKVSEAKKSGKVQGRAQMAIRLETLVVDGDEVAVRSNTLRFEAEGTGKRDATRIGIASGAGAVIGAIAGGGRGAAIGAVIGAGAGTGVTVATPGDEVEFRTEQLFQFSLERPVELKIR